LFLDLLNADDEHINEALLALEEVDASIAEKIDGYVFVTERLDKTVEMIEEMITRLKDKKTSIETKKTKIAERLHEFFGDGAVINGNVFAIKTYSTVQRSVLPEALSDEEKGRGIVTLTCRANDIPEGFLGEIKGVKFLLSDFPANHPAIVNTEIKRFKQVKKED